MATFLQHFQAYGDDPELVPYSPQVIEAETIENAAQLGVDSLMGFVNEGVIHSFVVVGILGVEDGEG